MYSRAVPTRELLRPQRGARSCRCLGIARAGKAGRGAAGASHTIRRSSGHLGVPPRVLAVSAQGAERLSGGKCHLNLNLPGASALAGSSHISIHQLPF
jgi:hypothetical protein